MTAPQTVIVTGGASGIGAATVRLLAEHGYRVVVADLQEDRGTAIAAEVDGLFVRHDAVDLASWEALLTTTVERHGSVQGLVTAAGVKNEYLLENPPDPEQFTRIVAVNQLGTAIGLQVVGGHLRQRRQGSIVTVSSGSAMPPSQSPDLAYVSSKWAVRGLSRVAARQLAPYGVRVNTVLPGLVRTPMIAKVVEEFPERVAAIEQAIPLRRMGEPIDIARTVHFLLSDLSGYCTGSELVVDGGSLA